VNLGILPDKIPSVSRSFYRVSTHADCRLVRDRHLAMISSQQPCHFLPKMTSNFFDFLKSSNSSPFHKKKALLRNFEEEGNVENFVEFSTALGLQFTETDFEGCNEKAYLDLAANLGLVPWKLIFDGVLSEDQSTSKSASDLIKSQHKTRFQTKHLEYSVDLLCKTRSDQSFLRGWSMIMFAYGSNLHKTEALNSLLQQIESYFIKPSFETRAAAYKAWRFVIYNLHLKDHIASRGKTE
jgi:Rap1-interacting factor 1 N terminal